MRLSTPETMQLPARLPFETTLKVRDSCLCLYVQRAARSLARSFDIALKPVGLTSGQFSLLMSLNRPQPPTLGSVAALLGLDRTTLTANLKPLQRRGLVETVADPQDKRMRLLNLTPAGHAILIAAAPIWEQAHADIEAKIADPDNLREALGILSTL